MRVAVAVMVLLLATPALAQLQGGTQENNTLTPPGDNRYPGPYYVNPPGQNHARPPRQPGKAPGNESGPPLQGTTTMQGNPGLPPNIRATISRNDSETRDSSGYKQGSQQIGGTGIVYVTIGNSHPSGYTFTHRALIPNSTSQWFYIDGTVLRDYNGPGHDAFHITALYNRTQNRNPRNDIVPLSPNGRPSKDNRRATTGPVCGERCGFGR